MSKWQNSSNKSSTSPTQATRSSASGAASSKTASSSKSGSSSSASKRLNILDIRTVDTKNGPKAKVQFAKDVEIFFKGQKVDLGEYNSGFLKTKEELLSDLDFLVDKEYITGEQAQERADKLDEKNITSVLQVAVEK